MQYIIRNLKGNYRPVSEITNGSSDEDLHCEKSTPDNPISFRYRKRFFALAGVYLSTILAWLAFEAYQEDSVLKFPVVTWIEDNSRLQSATSVLLEESGLIPLAIHSSV
jgi:hypothetical protein